jgi:hypothetical protein
MWRIGASQYGSRQRRPSRARIRAASRPVNRRRGLGFRVCFRECENGVSLFGGDRGFPLFEQRDPLDERRLGERVDAGR